MAEMVLREAPARALQAHVAALMAQRGACAPEQVFRTAGAQQGLSLLARLPRVALEQERVSFVPGHAFAADGSRTGSH